MWHRRCTQAEIDLPFLDASRYQSKHSQHFCPPLDYKLMNFVLCLQIVINHRKIILSHPQRDTKRRTLHEPFNTLRTTEAALAAHIPGPDPLIWAIEQAHRDRGSIHRFPTSPLLISATTETETQDQSLDSLPHHFSFLRLHDPSRSRQAFPSPGGLSPGPFSSLSSHTLLAY